MGGSANGNPQAMFMPSNRIPGQRGPQIEDPSLPPYNGGNGYSNQMPQMHPGSMMPGNPMQIANQPSGMPPYNPQTSAPPNLLGGMNWKKPFMRGM